MKKFLHLLLLVVWCVAGGGAAVAATEIGASNSSPTGNYLISEDRTWEYVTIDHGEMEDDVTTYTLDSYRFEGTENENGRDYAKLVLKDKTIWKKSKANDDILEYPENQIVDQCVGL